MADIFQDKIYQDLEKLNFTFNESRVYLALLELGPSLAGKIAKKLRMDRSSTYNALDVLVERGLVSITHETKRAIYVPQHPRKIHAYFKEKEELSQGISKSLEDLYQATAEKSKVTLFKGFKGLKTIFQDILDSSSTEPYYVIGSGGQFKEMMPYYSKLFMKKKEGIGLKTRRLTEGKKEQKRKSKYTEYRAVPIKIDNPATINIYDGKAAIFLWSKNPEAVLIENERVSKTLRGYFDLVWKQAKKI